MPPDRLPSHAERVDDLSFLGEEDPGSAMDVCWSDPRAEPRDLQPCGDAVQSWTLRAVPRSIAVG